MPSQSVTAPLRVKLIAALLALVTIALLVIGVVSALALRASSISRIEGQLNDIAGSIKVSRVSRTMEPVVVGLPPMPSDYLVAYVVDDNALVSVVRPDGGAPLIPDARTLRRLAKGYFTLKSQSTNERWRLLARPVQGSDAEFLVVGQSLAGVDDAVDRLIVAELFVGLGVLVLVGVGDIVIAL